MKTIVCLGVVLAFASCAAAGGAPPDGKLHGAIEFSYLTSYIWRGFDVYGPSGDSGIAPAVTLDLFGSGFGFRTQANRAVHSGFENTERWDYTIFYRNMLWPDARHAMAYHIGYVYYNYPDNSRTLADLSEMQGAFSFPQLLGIKGLVPTYVLVKLWPAGSGELVASRVDLTRGILSRGTASGWAHIFMLDYGIPITPLLPNQKEQAIRLHSEFVFNDGVGPAGQDVDHDWSNAVFGILTDFELGGGFSFTPAFYIQSSWDDSVNTEDEYWAVLTMQYRF